MYSYGERDNEATDEWKMPARFWQVLINGGYVLDMDDEEYTRLKASRKNGEVVFEGTDIYGDEFYIVLCCLASVKEFTELGGKRYKEAHKDEDRSF